MTDKKAVLKTCIKVVCFILLLLLVVYFVQKPFVHDQDNKKFQHLKGFYAEDRNTLDFIYIGASNVYPWYEPPVAWNNYGITSFDISVPLMPARSIRYLAEEVFKTQPDALIVVNLNTFKPGKLDMVRIHNIADNMKLSGTKVDMVNDLSEHADERIRKKDRFEFYFPMIRYHSGWSELKSDNFVRKVDGLKGGEHHIGFMRLSKDISGKVSFPQKRTEPDGSTEQALHDLIDYLKSKNAKALFILTPQMLGEKGIAPLKYMADEVESLGYPVLDLVNEEKAIGGIGLDYTQDLYDSNHTNVHGAAKYTNFLADYISRNYKIKDKRGDKAYSGWDEAVEQYYDLTASYTLDFERTLSERALDLKRPDELTASAENGKAVIRWSPVNGAEGYAVYRRRKTDDEDEQYTHWKCLGTIDGSSTSFTDKETKKKKEYCYTVVPVSYDNGKETYGCFDYSGVSVKIK